MSSMLATSSAFAMDLCSPDAVLNTVGCQSWYNTFEVMLNDPSTHNPQAYNEANGPAGKESQSIPADPAIPSGFVGQSDIQVKSYTDAPTYVQSQFGVDASTHAIMGAMEAGDLGQRRATVPYAYLGAEVQGHTWTTPSQSFYAYYGYWRNIQQDNVIHDEACNNTPGFCSPTDEFIWRGNNTGETNLVGVQWIFPTGTQEGDENLFTLGDSAFCPTSGASGAVMGVVTGIITGPCSDGPTQFGAEVVIGAGLAGNCAKWGSYSADCANPAWTGLYNDRTNYSGTTAQAWIGGGTGVSGWSTISPEESLVINRYVINEFGPKSLVTATSPYGFDINAPETTPGFFRDMNWYQSVAPSSVDTLYASAMSAVKTNAAPVINATEVPLPQITALNPVTNAVNNASDVASYSCIPSQVGACKYDTRQETAVANRPAVQTLTAGAPATTGNPFIDASFITDSPLYALTPTAGFYEYQCPALTGGAVSAGTCDTVFGNTHTGTWRNGYGLRLGSVDNGALLTFSPLNSFDPTNGYVPSATLIEGSMDAFVWYDNNGDGFMGAPDNTTVQGYKSGAFYTANVLCPDGPGNCGRTTNQGPATANNGNDSIDGMADGARGVSVVPANGGTWPPGSMLVHNAGTNPGGPWDEGPLGDPSHGSLLTPLAGNSAVYLPADPTECKPGQASGCITSDALLIPGGTAFGLTGTMTAHFDWEEAQPSGSPYEYAWSGSYTWTQSS
ncbi:MAG: hypothetical protein ACYDDF_04525 [Thermoplasmatota archaeon]